MESLGYLVFRDCSKRQVASTLLFTQLEQGGPLCHASHLILRRWQRSQAVMCLGGAGADAEDMGSSQSGYILPSIGRCYTDVSRISHGQSSVDERGLSRLGSLLVKMLLSLLFLVRSALFSNLPRSGDVTWGRIWRRPSFSILNQTDYITTFHSSWHQQ